MVTRPFLKNCIIHQLSSLILNNSALKMLEYKRLKLSEFLPYISEILPKVTDYLGLMYFRFDESELAYVLRQCRKLKGVLNFAN